MNDPAIRVIGPRPLEYIRIRLHRGGEADYVRELLEGTQAFWFKRLGELRDEGFEENSDEVQYARQRLHWLVNVMRDVTSGLIELAGGGR